MTTAGRVSTVWMVGLLACATVALAGIAAFMARVYRDVGWDLPARAARATAATAPPAVHGGETVEAAPTMPVPTPPAASDEESRAAVSLTIDTAVASLRARRLTIPVAGVDAGSLVPSFSEMRGTRAHEAVDIMAPAGTPVVAVEHGTVARLFTSEAGGLTIYQFDPTGSVAYYYAHLQGYAPGLSEGDVVSRGEVIGYVGSTGNARADAPHLHFAIFVLGPERHWWEGTAIDPHAVLK